MKKTTTEIKQYAERVGREDAGNGDPFFPEQIGKWAQVYYALGFLAVDPGNEVAQDWMRECMARAEADADASRSTTQFNAEYERALAVGRRYEATGDARVFINGIPQIRREVAA
jgi:hypothetical protein